MQKRSLEFTRGPRPPAVLLKVSRRSNSQLVLFRAIGLSTRDALPFTIFRTGAPARPVRLDRNEGTRRVGIRAGAGTPLQFAAAASHRSQRMFGPKKDAVQVHGKDPPPVGERCLAHRCRKGDPGGIHQDVEMPRECDHASDSGFPLFFAGHVEREHEVGGTGTMDLYRSPLTTRLVDVGAIDRRTLGREEPRRRRTNARCRTGHDGHSIGKSMVRGIHEESSGWSPRHRRILQWPLPSCRQRTQNTTARPTPAPATGRPGSSRPGPPRSRRHRLLCSPHSTKKARQEPDRA